MRVPRVSIGLPVFNGEKYIKTALDSLISQDFDDFELIISDNASTDQTRAICRAYAAKDARIQYYRNESNIGSAPNYRKVFELARAEFFKWCSYDDVWHPRFLSRCLQVFESAPPCTVLVYPLCDLIDEHGKVLGRAPDRVETRKRSPHGRLAEVLSNVSYAYPVWGLIRTDCLRRTKLTGSTPYWDETLLAELSLFGEIREVPEVLSQQRVHDANAVALCAIEQGTEVSNDPSKANRRTREALRAWTDPTQARKRVWLPSYEEHLWEHAKRVYHAPVPRFEKILCYLTVLFICYWSRVRKAGGLWRRRLASKLSNVSHA